MPICLDGFIFIRLNFHSLDATSFLYLAIWLIFRIWENWLCLFNGELLEFSAISHNSMPSWHSYIDRSSWGKIFVLWEAALLLNKFHPRFYFILDTFLLAICTWLEKQSASNSSDSYLDIAQLVSHPAIICCHFFLLVWTLSIKCVRFDWSCFIASHGIDLNRVFLSHSLFF